MKVDDLNQSDDLKEKLRSFVSNPKGFMLFSGMNGTGKTYSSQVVFDSIYVPPHLGKLFFTQVDLYMKWMEEIKRFGVASYLLERLTETPLLVLDDMGTRAPTEAFADFLYAVIEKRERNKSSQGTLITTNLNQISFRKMFGDAIVSRASSGRVLRFEGKDRRIQDF